jgi:hypothetical protein
MKLRELTIKEQPAPAPNPAGQGAPNPAPEQPAVKAAGAVQKVGQGAKMAAAKMGAKGGTGGMMAKGLDKLASGGALTGNLSKQIAPFAKQLSTILSDTTLRNKFMMLVKQAEQGQAKQQAAPESDVQELDTSLKGKDDYEAKKKALQDLQMDPNTSKDKDVEDEIKHRLHRLKIQAKKQKIETESNEEVDAIKQLAGLMSTAKAPDTAYNDLKTLAGIGEAATAGATSSGNIASVSNPAHAYGQRPRDDKGLPKAPQKKNKDGTTKNALDMDSSFFGAPVKRNS